MPPLLGTWLAVWLGLSAPGGSRQHRVCKNLLSLKGGLGGRSLTHHQTLQRVRNGSIAPLRVLVFKVTGYFQGNREMPVQRLFTSFSWELSCCLGGGRWELAGRPRLPRAP